MTATVSPSPPFDVVVVGGGINGAGIALQAAASGLKTALLESHDFASGTSSRSSKLIHGGLRYLEYFDFKLVRESLGEREAVMTLAPHLVWPLRFVMPIVPGGKPAWLIRSGLFLYDRLAPRHALAGTESLDLAKVPDHMGFDDTYRRAYVYSDCWADDARLVVANVIAAAEMGARIFPRTALHAAQRQPNGWRLTIEDIDSGATRDIAASVLVNAAGPWAVPLTRKILGGPTEFVENLVRGSHIVLPRLYIGGHATMLQAGDGRIVVTMPYENNLTLVGTTDSPFSADPRQVTPTDTECDYLLQVVNRFFQCKRAADDIVWSYAGVRPLFKQGHARDSNPTTSTRDYAFKLDRGAGGREAPLLTVLGGKLTTYRKLAAQALRELAPSFPQLKPPALPATLPGGDIGQGGPAQFAAELRRRYPWLPAGYAARFARTYGSRTERMLGDAQRLEDLGPGFGSDLHLREVEYLRHHEWARTVDDILWRRTKCGLAMSASQVAGLECFLADCRTNPMSETGT